MMNAWYKLIAKPTHTAATMVAMVRPDETSATARAVTRSPSPAPVAMVLNSTRCSQIGELTNIPAKINASTLDLATRAAKIRDAAELAKTNVNVDTNGMAAEFGNSHPTKAMPHRP